MTSASTPTTPKPSAPAPRPAQGAALTPAGEPLQSSHGATHIAEAVVSKIAGLATREVHGVYDLGGGAARTFGAIRERIPGASTNASQGVSVEVGEKQAAVDIQVVVEYGVAIADLAKAIRRNVIGSLERMTGLEVVEVNVSVDDVHLPGDDDNDDRADRGGRASSGSPRVA